jgi:hypothetical protein
LGSYYFHIIETNRRLEDEEGEDLPSLEAAMEQAEQIIREILESEEATVDLASIRIETADSAGAIQAEVGFDDALEPGESDPLIH